MFDDSGNKIQTVAKVFFWLGVVSAIGYGISLMKAEMPWLGILVWIVGSVLSWVSSLFIYGFGELVENSAKDEKKHSNKYKSGEAVESSAKNEKTKHTGKTDTKEKINKINLIVGEDDETYTICQNCNSKVLYGQSECTCGAEFDWNALNK